MMALLHFLTFVLLLRALAPGGYAYAYDFADSDGDDPFQLGCLYKYTEKANDLCDSGEAIQTADKCVAGDDTKLYERHAGFFGICDPFECCDLWNGIEYDCPATCYDNNAAQTGKCTTNTNYDCDPGPGVVRAAKCECFDRHAKDSDNGDDPLIAGCAAEYEYTNGNYCGSMFGARKYDSCVDSVTVREYDGGNVTCSGGPLSYTDHDCDVACATTPGTAACITYPMSNCFGENPSFDVGCCDCDNDGGCG